MSNLFNIHSPSKHFFNSSKTDMPINEDLTVFLISITLIIVVLTIFIIWSIWLCCHLCGSGWKLMLKFKKNIKLWMSPSNAREIVKSKEVAFLGDIHEI